MAVAAHRPASTPVVDVLFLVLPETLLLDLAGPAEAFRLANQYRARRGMPPAFRLRYLGVHPEAASSVGLRLAALEPLPDVLPPGAWVVLMGRPGEPGHVVGTSEAWLAARQWLSRVVAPRLDAVDAADADADTGTRVGAGGGIEMPLAPAPRLLTVCSGALLAADAGLVGTRCVTTHHELLGALERLAPHAQVCANRVFVQDGPLWSSAGITAGIDLALHAVGEVCGDAAAAAVAEVMVVFQRRGTDDPERSPLLSGRSHLHPAVHRVQNAVCERPGHDWTTDALAAVAHVTPRHLTRLFREHAGVTPRDYVERVRHAVAAQAISGGLPTARAAELAGFSNDRQWRRAQARARRTMDG
jgi:transcriptional regulator GlxA family with amidase domain